MPDFIKYETRTKYPHMMPNDVAIWERFIAANPAAFDAVAYDVAVGEGAAFDTIVNKTTGGDANRLYQRKIDVVGVKGEVLFIIEIKPAASTSSIGQVKGYATLYKRDYTPTQAIQALIITDRILPEMEFLAREEKVQLLVA